MIIIVFLFWFKQYVFFGHLFVYMDLTLFFYPWRYFLAETLKAGALPLWNPYFNAGTPFLADPQSGIFYPPSLLYLILPFDLGFNWFALFHYLIAAGGAYWLGRELKLSTVAGLIMSLVFTYSGYLLSVDCMLTTLSAAAWLPLALLFYRRFLIEGTLRQGNLIVSAGLLAFIYLGGEPTIIYWTFWLFIFYALYLKKNILLAAAPFVLFVLLAAAQIIPFAEFAYQCTRVSNFTTTEAGHWSIQPYEFLKFFLPYLAFKPGESLSTTQWLRTLYMGVVPLLLVPFAFLRPAGRSQYFWLAIVVFSALVSLGLYFPLYRLLLWVLPGLPLIRYPVKFIFLAVFGLTILAGQGYDGLLSAVKHRKTPAQQIIWAYLLAGFVLAELFFIFFFWQLGAPVKELALYYNSITLGLSLFFLGTAAVLFSLLVNDRLPATLFAGLLIALCLVDLYTANYNLAFTVPAAALHFKTPNYERLQNDHSLFRVCPSPAIANRSYQWSETEVRNFTVALFSIRERLFANQTMLAHLPNAHGYGSLHLANYVPLSQKLGHSRNPRENQLLNLFNIKYVTTNGRVAPPPAGFRLLSQEAEKIRSGKIALYENQQALPRGFFVPRAKVIKDQAKILEYLCGPQFNPRREVVLSQQPTGDQNRGGWGAAKLQSYQAEQVDFQVTTGRGGLLFVSDSYYPGWRAYVDGQPVKIYEANYAFRAVEVPVGQHQVRFAYEPLSVKIGAVLSLLTLLGSLVFAITLRRKQ